MSVITSRPEEILSYHAEVTRRHAAPNPVLAGYTQNFMTATIGRGGAVTSTMFYPVVHEGTYAGYITERQGHEFCKVLARDLEDAVTYQVTAEMTQIMQAVYVNSLREVTVLDEAELPAESGFAWLDEGWPIRDKHGFTFVIRAVSWHYREALMQPEKKYGEPGRWPSVRVILWVHVSDDPPEYQARLDRPDMGKLQVVHAGLIPCQLPLLGVEPDSGPEEPGSFLGLVRLLWMFLGMEIVSTVTPRIKNHYRKQALKSLKHGEVRVVILRKIKHVTEPGDDHQPVNWSCRWIVQGHWRHLTNPQAEPGGHVHHAVPLQSGRDKLCGVCGGRVTWVAPYIKGPDGLSLKANAGTLYKLAR